MDISGLQCHGCGSSRVVFDPVTRKLTCNQCGFEEYYSRATLGRNGKIAFERDNAINFFTQGKFDNARHYALEVLNILMDNAPCLFIIAYYDEYVERRSGSMTKFFHDIKDVALEYDEVEELRKLFLASAYNMIDYEADILTLIALNMQSPDDAGKLCEFVDTLCPYLILKHTSMNYLNKKLVDIYMDLAGHCSIPKTCFALLKSIEANPDSPYVNNSFYLKSKAQYFYTNYVLSIGDVINSISDSELKQKFTGAFTKKREKYEADAQLN